MKPSKQPTPHFLIKAHTHADYDPINFAIIHITPEWLMLLSYRLSIIKDFHLVRDFNCFSYWDSALGYFHLDKAQVSEQQLLDPYDDQGFIMLEPGELDALPEAENRLEAQQLLITKDGIGRFEAYAKHTDEKYWTAEFNLKRLLKHYNELHRNS